MNESENGMELEKRTNASRAARKIGVLPAILAVLIGGVMVVTAILLSNVFTGHTHVNEPGAVITVDSTYPVDDMYTGENFSFAVSWTPIHDVQDVVLWAEIVKPDVSLNDTSVRFTWIVDSTYQDAVLTDLGDTFTLQSAPMNAIAGETVTYLVQMCYYVSGDWTVNFWADGSIA